MPRLFIAQSLVDVWISTGQAQLMRDILRIGGAGSSTDLFINPAVFFDRVDGAEGDPIDVVGRVKTSQELAQIGAEHYETSVLVGDSAYTVIPGIVAAPVDARGAEIRLDTMSWGRLLRSLEGIAAS
jgi:hypothetical protein